MEVPAALAQMDSLTSLDLGGNHIQRGWEHLRPLTRLQALKASVHKRNVPEALKTLENWRNYYVFSLALL